MTWLQQYAYVRQGASGLQPVSRGLSSPACTVILKPRRGVKYNPRVFSLHVSHWFLHQLQQNAFLMELQTDQLPLRYTDFKRMYSIVPPH
jgi:hypothetical protein